MRKKLVNQLEKYKPFNEQEERDREVILKMLQSEKDIFYRTNLCAHMTASAWVVNRERTKTIMVHHNIYNSWSWMGGHADGNENLLEVALREVKEECGVENVRPVSQDIFSIEVLPVSGHMKNGKYVNSHLHLNITYLIEAGEAEKLSIKEDENSNAGWFTFSDAMAASSEEWFKEHIYAKLIEKLNNSNCSFL